MNLGNIAIYVAAWNIAHFWNEIEYEEAQYESSKVGVKNHNHQKKKEQLAYQRGPKQKLQLPPFIET